MELTLCRSVEGCRGGGGHLVDTGLEAGQGKSGAFQCFVVLHVFSSSHVDLQHSGGIWEFFELLRYIDCRKATLSYR